MPGTLGGSIQRLCGDFSGTGINSCGVPNLEINREFFTNPAYAANPASDGVHGTPRVASETRMQNIASKVYVKIT